MKLYYLLGRLARPVLFVVFYCYNIVVEQPRARVVLQNELDEILLVKDWVGPNKWSLPGGGIHKKEAAATAASRELYEETGISIQPHAMQYAVTVRASHYNAPIFLATTVRASLSEAPHNPREITHIEWFPSDKLPELSKTSHQAIASLQESRSI